MTDAIRGGMTNQRIATTFDRVAELLEAQAASTHRVRAWREGARAVRDHDRELGDVFRDHGRVGLEAIPHIGARLANVIIELIRTGGCAILDRLRGDAVRRFEELPGLGHTLAERIQRELHVETLEELAAAARDGRLAHVPGLGPRRIATIHDVLAARLAASRHEAPVTREPPVALLLEVDRAYREGVAAHRLPTIAPRRFNPGGIAWLPILHLERDGWQLTALFSNTALAHKLGRTTDWVVIYFHEPHQPDGQATVVTERRGPQVGRRVVRGREAECAALDAAREQPRRAG